MRVAHQRVDSLEEWSVRGARLSTKQADKKRLFSTVQSSQTFAPPIDHSYLPSQRAWKQARHIQDRSVSRVMCFDMLHHDKTCVRANRQIDSRENPMRLRPRLNQPTHRFLSLFGTRPDTPIIMRSCSPTPCSRQKERPTPSEATP